MTVRLAFVVVLFLSLQTMSVRSPTLAQTAVSQMDRPIWTVGSRWVQNIQRRRQGLWGREVQTLIKIDDFEGVPAYFLQFEIEWTDILGKKRTDRFTKIRNMDLTPIAILDEKGKLVWRGKTNWLKWPLVEGETWNTDGEEQSLGRSGWNVERVSGPVFVKGVEEIRTAAGTFTAFHVNTFRRYVDSLGAPSRHDVEDDWISPEPRIWVKYTFQGGGEREEGELVEYQLK